MYMASVNGENVLDKAEIISDELVASIIVQMGQDFEATNLEWAEGLFRALNKILMSASFEAKKAAIDHLKELCDGDA